MARRKRTYRTTSSRRPQWLSIITAITSAVNALLRIFRLFRGPASRTPRTGSAPRSVPRTPTRTKAAPPPARGQPADIDGGIPELFRNKRSDVIVQASGLIVKVLPDDTDTSDGSGQHQRFLVELVDRRRTTIKVCHNLKFGRVPAREGQVVGFRGEYEYNELGGTVHWTHHDPLKIHDDGWIEIDGERYG